MKTGDDIRKKIAQLREMNTSYLKEIKRLAQKEMSKDFQIISYFTYSLNIFHEHDRENFGLGTFHIQNLGEKPLTNPYICIKVSPDSPFHFSGKYLYPDSKQVRVTDAWERLNDSTDKHEFWLRPNKKRTLHPNETLNFSNFQIKWTAEKSSYAGSIMGFTYGDEIKEGINALNQINISGR